MAKLAWTPISAPVPRVQMWGASDGLVTYVISRDFGCRPDDRYYGRFAVSAKLVGMGRDDLGLHDTLEQAQAAAEASRSGANVSLNLEGDHG